MMKKLIAGVIVVSVALLPISPVASAAYTVKPKVGQCFMHTRADVSAPYAIRNPISCSKTHNAETFTVARWPYSIPPEDFSDEEALEIADSLCMAFAAGGKMGPFFTYWAWYTPEPKAWAKGERWLRCDAMRILNDKEPYKFASWKGKKLGAQINL